MACPDDSPLTRRGKPLQAGTISKVVSGRLGHSTVSITLETYSYVIPSLQEDAARRAAVLVFAELGLRHVCKMLIRWNRKASRIAENPGSTWVSLQRTQVIAEPPSGHHSTILPSESL